MKNIFCKLCSVSLSVVIFFSGAIPAYSREILVGDVDYNGKVEANDALSVLQHVVGKINLDLSQRAFGDVDGNYAIDVSDALYILQYSVNKINSFPVDITGLDERIKIMENNQYLFNNTYQSMIDRTHENGYAQTSVNGVYPGMFGRDSSIQMMAHVEAGDYDLARRIMQYLLDYHREYNYKYVLHVMNENAGPISDKVQVDSTYFFLHSWYLYATNAPESPEKTAFINEYTQQVKDFANYFLDNGYVKSNGLVFNPSLEHTREGRYWQCYDLLTNTYVSQALHELSIYFKETDPESAKRWGEVADGIVEGVHETLVDTVEDKKVYMDLYDVENSKKVVGFSWVNLAPMGCDWYGADEQILENTYEMYLKYGAVTYYDKWYMLDACSLYNGEALTPQRSAMHVIGKGLVWEMLYCKKTGRQERLNELIEFVTLNSEDMYRETWGYTGGGSDTANQEHASWMLYGMEKILGLRINK